MRGLAEDLAALGYAAVVPTWSYSPMAGDDALCALAWLHANAEVYGFDTERVAVFGHSGGATLAILTAAIDEPAEFLEECPYDFPQSGAVQGAISYAGSFMTSEWFLTYGKGWVPYTLAEMYQISREEAEEVVRAVVDTPFERWLEIEGFSDNATHWIHTQAAAWIDGSEPPILLIHGAKDNTINKLDSEGFAAYLETKGVDFQLLIIPSATHDLCPNCSGFDETWEATLACLAQVLK
jgi:acetyl esterase/lipase